MVTAEAHRRVRSVRFSALNRHAESVGSKSRVQVGPQVATPCMMEATLRCCVDAPGDA